MSPRKKPTLLAQASRALWAGADVRGACTIGMLGEEYLRDSVERGKQPRTMEQRESRLNAHILRAISDMPVAKWRVEHSRKVMEKGSKTIFSNRGREDLAAFDALVAHDRERTTVTDLLPPPRRRRWSA